MTRVRSNASVGHEALGTQKGQSAESSQTHSSNEPPRRNVPSVLPGHPASIPVNAGATSTPIPIQRKLTIGAVDDPLETEAEQMAERLVASAPANEGGAIGSPATLRRSAQGSATRMVAPPIVHDVLRSNGQPLDAGTRAYFEPRLGRDLSSVRVHADSRAAESAHSVQALAYTAGNDLVFGSNQYQPGTDRGKKLLAHELTHVAQQTDGPAPQSVRGADVRRTQDKDATSQKTAPESDKPPGGAPPVVIFDIEPVAKDDSQDTGTAQRATDGSLQRMPDSAAILRRAPKKATAPKKIVAKKLKWSDFPASASRKDGLSAQTGFKYSYNQRSGFSASFNRQHSWSYVPDQTPGLLDHEQHHLDLAVLMANKANAAAAEGKIPLAELVPAYQDAIDTYNKSYDDDTDHGRKADLQAKWASDIDNGVVPFPMVSVPN